MEASDNAILEIEKVQFCTNESNEVILASFQCPRVRKTGEVVLILANHAIDQVCLVHDCASGNCTFKEAETTVMVEREAVTKLAFTYVHDTNCDYLINKFYLGESLKYFNIA